MIINYQWPFRGKYKRGSVYGRKGSMWSIGWHTGTDFSSTNHGGDGKILPIAPGKIISNKKSNAYGNHVLVAHEDGYVSLYAHMAYKSPLRVGTPVTYDTVLGQEGTTGNSDGVHLHLEVHKGFYIYPSKIDPEKHIKERLPLSAQDAIGVLATKGVIDSPGYWTSRYKDVKYTDELLSNLARLTAKQKNFNVTDVKVAIDLLHKAGAMNSPKYWLDNHSKIMYLGKLLCNAANHLSK